ncbi:MAG: LEA type 2 family protein [Steroidobacteraceae bacterium]
MIPPSRWLATLVLAGTLALGACAALQPGEPLQVSVAGIESLPGEGLELRMLVKLRVQNPNDAPFEYDGAQLQLDVLDRPFASGVSDARGSVPRFGESVVAVPVTVSVLRMVGQAIGLLDGKPVDKVGYALRGKLSGTGLRASRFRSQGELDLRGLGGLGGLGGSPSAAPRLAPDALPRT